MGFKLYILTMDIPTVFTITFESNSGTFVLSCVQVFIISMYLLKIIYLCSCHCVASFQDISIISMVTVCEGLGLTCDFSDI